MRQRGREKHCEDVTLSNKRAVITITITNTYTHFHMYLVWVLNTQKLFWKMHAHALQIPFSQTCPCTYCTMYILFLRIAVICRRLYVCVYEFCLVWCSLRTSWVFKKNAHQIIKWNRNQTHFIQHQLFKIHEPRWIMKFYSARNNFAWIWSSIYLVLLLRSRHIPIFHFIFLSLSTILFIFCLFFWFIFFFSFILCIHYGFLFFLIFSLHCIHPRSYIHFNNTETLDTNTNALTHTYTEQSKWKTNHTNIKILMKILRTVYRSNKIEF